MTTIPTNQGSTTPQDASEQLNLAQAVEQVLREVHQRAVQLGAEFILELGLTAAESSPGPLPAILGHLIENSLDAIARSPRPTTDTVPHQIIVTIEQQGDQQTLSVTDTGDGLDPRLLDAQGNLIFGRSIKPGATALGLRLVRDAIGRAGGTFHISPYPHGGVHAHATLPIAALSAAREAA
ncbi:MAG: ATP-binding protein [Phycisphaeraceae bacterium]